jgi:Leucine-rich repeat (LRR) protein
MRLIKVLILIIISFLSIYSCKKSNTTKSGEPIVINFSDPAFEALIREVLNIPSGDITHYDMIAIDNLSGYERGISSIDGIEYCKNLLRINIRTNQISDISPLAELNRLMYINLWTNQISDISALAELPDITNLYLGGNHIEDIYPLIQNQGIGSGDIVVISYNPLNSISLTDYIPQLLIRGVEIYY